MVSSLLVSDLAAQVATLGADSLLPPAKVPKAALARAEAKPPRGRPKTAKPREGVCSKAECYRRRKAKAILTANVGLGVGLNANPH